MSIKTLRKRIALVAVSALGAGLLSVAPASATDITMSNVALAATNYCKAGTDKDSTAPRYIAVGASQVFTLSTNGDAAITITGPGKWVATNATGSIDSTGKVMTTTDTGTYIFQATGTGAIQVAFAAGSAPSTTLSSGTYYFIAQSACSSGYDAGTSYAQLHDTEANTAAATNVDVLAATTIGYSTSGVQKSYLRISANDAYGAGLAISTSQNVATVTGGCVINFDETASTGTTTAIATGTGADTNALVIVNDNTPRTCTVTSVLDGVEIAKKTVKFTGDYASITVSTADSSAYWAYGEDGSASATALNADAIVYVVKDSAGNTINPAAAPTYIGLTNGFTQVTVANGYYSYSALTTNGVGSLDVIATSTTVRGKGTYQLSLTRRTDGVTIKSNVVTAEINKSPYTFEVSFDKASYQVGDIITMTITAKDSAGNLAYDGSTVGSAISVSVGGTTALSTPTSTDSFVNGVKKYKFAAGTTAANYGYSVAMSTGSSQAAVTGTISITAPSTGVSNAEVLAAIVKLIASINKQIRALQKSLKR